jgi:hypothetical protein
MKKMIICDQRFLLPLFHGLRMHGQTANCCPNFSPQDYVRSYTDNYEGRFFYSTKYTSKTEEPIGQYDASNCMEEENYSIDIKNEMRKNMVPTPATEEEILNNNRSRVAQDMGYRLVPFFFKVCDEANRKSIINFLFNDRTTPSVWFHNQNHYPMEMFTESEYLYYEYCNYKPYKG